MPRITVHTGKHFVTTELSTEAPKAWHTIFHGVEISNCQAETITASCVLKATEKWRHFKTHDHQARSAEDKKNSQRKNNDFNHESIGSGREEKANFGKLIMFPNKSPNGNEGESKKNRE